MTHCPSQLLPLIGRGLQPLLQELYRISPSIPDEDLRVGNCRIREFEGLIETLTGTRVRSAASETKACGMQHFGDADRPLLDMIYALCHPSRPRAESRPEIRSLMTYLEQLRRGRGEMVATYRGTQLNDDTKEGVDRRVKEGLGRAVLRRTRSCSL